jgi:3-phosphoshikimate 1-carboxyvinyltransferase
MSDVRVDPCHKLQGVLSLPGDKSISHRLAMLAALADGETQIENFSVSADCHSTLACLRGLGVSVMLRDNNHVLIQGQGLRGLNPPYQILDAGNSGSTIRMLSGLLAGHPFVSTVAGDSSLSKRPMGRIIEPLTRMGARIEAREQKYPPLVIHGDHLNGISYSLPVPSAQVKSAVLLAGLLAQGKTAVHEVIPTRNHTEIALQAFGVNVNVEIGTVSLEGGQSLKGGHFEVPGDPSSAAFWVAAALLVPESNLTIRSVGLNPTRTYFLEFLQSMGADISRQNVRERNGEKVGDVIVRRSQLEGGLVEASKVPALIDELPVLAVLGAISRRGLTVQGAQELRVKESDRIRSVVQNLRGLGAQVKEFEDGFEVQGNQSLKGGEIDSYDDHRIAMTFSVAALAAAGPVTIRGADCVRVSYPSFYQVLKELQS